MFEDPEARAATLAFRHGRPFRVSKGDNAPSFLFGTPHLAEPRVATLSDSVGAGLARASIVAAESAQVTAPAAHLDVEARVSHEAAILAPPVLRADHLLDVESFAALMHLPSIGACPRRPCAASSRRCSRCSATGPLRRSGGA